MLRGVGRLFGLAVGVVGGWLVYSLLGINHKMRLPPAVSAERHSFHGKTSCRLSYYVDTAAPGRPLLLVHSINAAGSAYEMRPLFQHYRGTRPVYALELPGFGFSERSDREYSIALYVNAILDALRQIGSSPADVIALSLGCEFAALAAVRQPELFHSLTLISPTGLGSRPTMPQQANSDFTDRAYRLWSNPLYSQAVYDLLVTRFSINFFLKQSFAGEPDQGLLDYSYLTTHQPGARHAPLYFVSGKLFSSNILEQGYACVSVPVLVLYDQDANVSFERLPELLDKYPNWRARRIMSTRGLPHFEQIDRVTAALDEFWDETAR